MEPQTKSFGELFKRITEVFEARVNRDLQAHGITLAQMKVLASLDQTKGQTATLKELERFFNTSQATMAGLAVRLEKKGLVASSAGTEDRRVKHIRLTEKGKALCRETGAQMAAGERWLVGALEPSESEQLRRLLMKVYESIK